MSIIEKTVKLEVADNTRDCRGEFCRRCALFDFATYPHRLVIDTCQYYRMLLRFEHDRGIDSDKNVHKLH